MQNKRTTKIIGAVLAVTLAVLPLAGCGKQEATDNPILKEELYGTEYVQQQYSEAPKTIRKNETVYVNLSPEGIVHTVNVTDWLHTDSPQVRAEDISDLEHIYNVKSLTDPIYADGRLYWDMDTTDLYYSGVSQKKPPVEFSIEYFLNGTAVSADEIAGQSGEVAIKISVKNTLKKTVKVMGQSCEISCPMLMVGGMIIPEGKFDNIAAENGSTISDGSKQMVFFAGIPGIDESLGLSKTDIKLVDKSFFADTYTVTATAENFEMGNMMFAVLPLASVGSFGNGGFTESIDGIKDVLSDLEVIQNAMNGLDAQKLIGLLYGDSNKIEDMMNAVNEAAQLYSENEKMLKVLSKYMTDENMKKLDKLINDLNKTDINAILDTINDPAVKALLGVLPKLSQSLAGLGTLADDLDAVMPMLQSLGAEMDDPEIQQSLKNLPATMQKLKKLIAAVNQNKELIDTVCNLASGDSASQIEALVNTADKYIGAAELSDREMQLLAGKMKEWMNFGGTYNIFTQCMPGTKSSVMFTYKTDAVSAPSKDIKQEKQEKKTDGENKTSEWFKGLFK